MCMYENSPGRDFEGTRCQELGSSSSVVLDAVGGGGAVGDGADGVGGASEAPAGGPLPLEAVGGGGAAGGAGDAVTGGHVVTDAMRGGGAVGAAVGEETAGGPAGCASALRAHSSFRFSSALMPSRHVDARGGGGAMLEGSAERVAASACWRRWYARCCASKSAKVDITNK